MKSIPHSRFPFAHTFSVVARDPESGQIGVAVQSHWFSAGQLVAWAEAGTGVVATQAIVEVNYGPLGLELMRTGKRADEALSVLVKGDRFASMRQVAMIDRSGNVAAYTGSRCIECAGHITGENYSVQANMMANDAVVPAMARAFESTSGDLAERLVVVLEAAQEAGGDIRGQQSAALLVVGGKPSKYPWKETIVDLRIDDHPEPVVELRSLLVTQRAYRLMNQGDSELAKGEVEMALQSYSAASKLAPHICELPFWHAVTLAGLGRMDEALPLFRQVFQDNGGWADLVRRLPAAGLLKEDPEMLARILSVI